MVIQNGKVVYKRDFPSSDKLFNRHQFPIRKAGYDHRTVEQMLISRHSFQSSVKMMEKMRNRISQYNKEIVPYAQ